VIWHNKCSHFRRIMQISSSVSQTVGDRKITRHSVVVSLCLQDNVLEWLQHLQLTDYYDALTADGYYSDIDHVVEITWEDLEEIGIKKLGIVKIVWIKLTRTSVTSHTPTHTLLLVAVFSWKLPVSHPPLIFVSVDVILGVRQAITPYNLVQCHRMSSLSSSLSLHHYAICITWPSLYYLCIQSLWSNCCSLLLKTDKMTG